MDIDEVFKAALACLELGILEPRAQILGGVVIFDLEGFGLQQAWQVTPSVATKVLDLMGVSIKILNSIFITASIFHYLINVCCLISFLSEGKFSYENCRYTCYQYFLGF